MPSPARLSMSSGRPAHACPDFSRSNGTKRPLDHYSCSRTLVRKSAARRCPFERRPSRIEHQAASTRCTHRRACVWRAGTMCHSKPMSGYARARSADGCDSSGPRACPRAQQGAERGKNPRGIQGGLAHSGSSLRPALPDRGCAVADCKSRPRVEFRDHRPEPPSDGHQRAPARCGAGFSLCLRARQLQEASCRGQSYRGPHTHPADSGNCFRPG